jgi:pyrrolidone-carboxylate peptidase
VALSVEISGVKIIAGLVIAAGLAVVPGIAHAQDTNCYDTTVPLTVEEQRLDDTLVAGGPAVGPALVRLAGFDGRVTDFTTKLCRQVVPRQAQQFVAREGNALWKAAVARAQSTTTLAHDAYDDRPLYWARLQLTTALRQWQPRFALSTHDRAKLIQQFDWASRGLSDSAFAPRPGVRKIAVTGFDPFQLTGTNVRRANPAGAAALQLDGREITTPTGKVVLQAAVLPVLWGGFDEGVVEQFYGTALEQKPDAFVTISQGRPGKFDIERWAARWRGGFADNNNVGSYGSVPNAAGWPQPVNEFIETSLPFQKMIDAGTGPFPVVLNRSFCEWVVVGSQQECRTDEPTPGRVAAVGGGGNYLSNESMYRANRVRIGYGATNVLGGHLHTPVLGQPVDPAALTDAAFEKQRRDIADQVKALVSVV